MEKIDRTEKVPTAYVAYSKHNFFAKQLISAFTLEQGVTPLNPFMNWDYFLNDLVARNLIVRANNNLIYLADEVWTFGQISNGVFHEIILARKSGKKVRHFSCGKKISDIEPLNFVDLEFEQELIDEFSYERVIARLQGKDN